MKLLDVMVASDEARLEELAARWHVVLDPKKRLTAAEQVARGVVMVPRWLDGSRLSEGTREALRLLAASPRGVAYDSLPREVDALLEEGFAFRDPARPERVVI